MHSRATYPVAHSCDLAEIYRTVIACDTLRYVAISYQNDGGTVFAACYPIIGTDGERRRRRGRLKGSEANKLAALRAASSRTTAPSAIYRARSAFPLPFNCPRAANVHLINAKSLREITISRAGEQLKRLNSPRRLIAPVFAPQSTNVRISARLVFEIRNRKSVRDM